MSFEIGGEKITSGPAILLGALGGISILVGGCVYVAGDQHVDVEAVRSDPDIKSLIGREDIPSRVLTARGRKLRTVAWCFIGGGASLCALAVFVQKNFR